MVNYEKSFKTNLPRFQGIVEKAFDISLGQIRIHPEERYEEIEGLRKCGVVAVRAGIHGIYCPGREHTTYLSEIEARTTLFHELTHIAQMRYLKAQSLVEFALMRSEPRIPYWIDEGFPEFMAMDFMKTQRVEAQPNEAYLSYYRSMASAVKEHRLSSPREILEFATARREELPRIDEMLTHLLKE